MKKGSKLTVEIMPTTGVPMVIIKNLSGKIIEDHIPKSLFIYGKSGCGKSHMAAEQMYRAMYCFGNAAPALYKYKFIWENVSDLLFKIRQTYGNKDLQGEEKRIVDSLSQVHFLVLDDLGAEKTSDWSLQTLYLIINKRYENERLTIITSNLSLGELAAKMEDDRLASRIKGMGEIIEIKGKDKRNS